MKSSLLLAEGNAELRELYSGFLRKHGYDVTVAEDGLECLRHLKRVSPDLLVLDLELTWGGGDGVLDWLREDSGRAGMPVILTATAGGDLGAAEVADPPVVESLAKPFTLTELADSVRAAIAKSGQARPNLGRHETGSSELYIG